MKIQNEIGQAIINSFVANGYQEFPWSGSGMYRKSGKVIEIESKEGEVMMKYTGDNRQHSMFLLEIILTYDIQINVELEDRVEYYNQRYIKYLPKYIERDDYLECLDGMLEQITAKPVKVYIDGEIKEIIKKGVEDVLQKTE